MEPVTRGLGWATIVPSAVAGPDDGLPLAFTQPDTNTTNLARVWFFQ